MNLSDRVQGLMPQLQQIVVAALRPNANIKNPSARHGPLLFSLVVALNARRILELGVATGMSTRPLLTGAALTGGSVVSVDVRMHRIKDLPHELKSMWTFHQSDAIQYLERCVDERVTWDLVLVDDWHAYEHVRRELELLSSLVSPSGLVVLHDLMHTCTEPTYVQYDDQSFVDIWSRWKPYGRKGSCDEPYKGHRAEFSDGGPYRGVVDFVRSHPSWEFATIPASHGMTLLRKSVVGRPNGEQ